MQNNYPYIISLCQKISQSGKTPSLALIRNKSDRPLAIPEVIQALKNWKDDPDQEIESEVDSQVQPVSLTLEERVEQLELQVKELQRQLKISLHNS